MAHAMPLLDPAPYAVGVFPEHYNHGSTISFKMQQKAFSASGGDYTVTGFNNDYVHFRIRGKYWSLHGRKTFSDGNGNDLFEISEELMHMHTIFVSKHARTGSELFRVKGKIFTMHDEMTVSLRNEAAGRQEEIVVRGDWADRKAEMRLGRDGPILATTTRDWWTAKEWLAGASTYAIHVAPGVDCSLMVALCVLLDKIHDENSSPTIVLV